MRSGVRVRPFETRDLDALYEINEASTPGVGSVPAERWSALVAMCDLILVATIDERPVGMIMVMFEGCPYDSVNYAWISERYPRFSYVDRVAVAPSGRGAGIGRRLYEAAFASLHGSRDVLLCEVNLAPPNSGSERFHAALGFEPIGERWLPDRSKGVIYLSRDLS